MSLTLNNSKDITCDSLYLLDSSNVLQNILTLIGSGGSGGSGITTLTGTLPLGVTSVSATNKNLTIDLSAYSTTSSINTLLAGKQNTLTAGTGIVFTGSTINTSAITNATATLPLTVTQTPNTIALATLFKPSTVTVSTGLLGLSNDTLGTLSLSLTGLESRTALKLTDGTTVRDLTSNTSGSLLWNSNTLMIESAVKTLIATSVTASSTSGLNSAGNNTTGAVALSLNTSFTHPSLRLSDGASGYKTISADSSALKFEGGALSTTAALATEVATLNTSINGKQNTVTGLTQTNSGASLITTLASRELHVDAYTAAGSVAQSEMRWKYDTGLGSMMFANVVYWGWIPQSGQIFRMYNAQSAISLEVSATSNTTTIHGTFVNSSDERLKTDIQQADYTQCQQLFDNVEVKTYKRNDTETELTRLGFIAQDIQQHSSNEWENLVRSFLFEQEDKTQVERLGLDYSRLTCVLWGVCKNQQKQITDLTARVTALETQPVKKTKKAS
jgi:hypothetical protein